MSYITKIGANTFTVPPLPYMKTLRLVPIVAPAVTEVLGLLAALAGKIDLTKKDFELGDLDTDEILPILRPVVDRFFASLSPNNLETITRAVLGFANCDGIPLFRQDGTPGSDLFDTVMMGRTIDYFRLLVFALQVNFPDFFALRGKLGAAATGSSSTESSASTGPSGD